MTEFVTFKWRPADGYRSKFDASSVNVLWSMLKRHGGPKARLTCITDDADGISNDVRIVPLWPDLSEMISPHGVRYPSCYRRLKLFSEEARDLIGDKFVVMDLDVVIVKDISPLFSGREDFKIWGDTARGTPYNGSLWMLKAGARRRVWDTFDPVVSPRVSKQLGYIGSDQGWIGACLGPHEAKWGVNDGVYSFRNHIQRTSTQALPQNARIVIFHGAVDPWMREAQAISWVRDHYR